VGDPEFSPARHDSNQVASIELEELQDLFQCLPDLVIDTVGRKGNEPGRDVGQESLELKALLR
jgi:hypothetical protein